jgi:hypothetical protein
MKHPLTSLPFLQKTVRNFTGKPEKMVGFKLEKAEV